jgi:hypothetical protein
MPDGILNLMALGLPIPNPIITNPLGVAPIQLSKNGLIAYNICDHDCISPENIPQ